MTTDANKPATEETVPLTIDLEREVLETLESAYNELVIAIDEYESVCEEEQKQPSGKEAIGLTYRDARNMQAVTGALETRVRRLGQRYREDLVEAHADAARRAQEPFTGKERSMLRTAITGYGEALTKEAKRLQDMSRDNEARALLGDAAVLLERIRPLFAEQHEFKGEHGPLFAGGVPRVTETNPEGAGTEPEAPDA
ncbi:MAG: hypothetical protein AB7N73_16240 [Gemmatimonadales bacterium]